ncbi:MAG: 5'-nucleotidase C-terminal domain-containing protein, partial [Leptospirales bacterium]
RVGIFSLLIDNKHPDYVESFSDPEAYAEKMTKELREGGAEIVIALTHLKASQDIEILEALGDDGPDLVIGGHEHDKQMHEVDGRYIIKADADAKTAIIAKVTINTNSPPDVDFEFRDINSDITPDPVVQKKVDWWFTQFDNKYCDDLKLPLGCTKDKFSFAKVKLIAEELQIRKYETNFGNWITDQALHAYKKEGAQIAFLNSGSIRLNQNILQGSNITRSHIEEIFPYKSNLKLIQITGADLQNIINHSIEDWTGNGWWLQIAGFAFTFNPETKKAENLTLLSDKGPRPILPDEEILAVTGDYLLDSSMGTKDGYTMLNMKLVVSEKDSAELSAIVITELKANYDTGIGPELEGRICNTEKKGKCLAIEK